MTNFFAHHIGLTIGGSFFLVTGTWLLLAWKLGHLEPVE